MSSWGLVRYSQLRGADDGIVAGRGLAFQRRSLSSLRRPALPAVSPPHRGTCREAGPRNNRPLRNCNYTASSLRTVVRRALGQLPIPELGWSRGHETMVSKLDAV